MDNFTINNNKLYYLDNGQGKLKTGYFVLIDDGMATTHYHLLVYADQSGEVLKMKRLPSRFIDYRDKKSMVSMVKKLRLHSQISMNITRFLW